MRMAERDTWELTREMFLDEEEVEAVRNALATRIAESTGAALWAARTDQLIFEMLTFTGLRNSEFCHLRLSDVPPALKQQAVRVTGTPRQDRVVAIPETLASSIAAYIRDIRPHLATDAISGKALDQPVVLNDRGRPLDRTTLYRRVVKILAAAGFESRASVQLLRHTYGYLAYKRTQGNLLFVQQQLGHSHPMVTAIYAEFVKFSPQDLANQVGETSLPTRPAKTLTTSTRKKGTS
jgi:site-specific recombinase XerD